MKVVDASNSKFLLSKKPTHLAVLFAFYALSAGPAYAVCTGLGTATATCTGIDTGNKSSTFGGDQTIQATNWTLTNGNLYIRDGGSPGTLSFTGDDVNITYGGTTNGALTAYSASGDVKLKLNSGTITTTGSNAYGLYAAATSADGTATINNAATINTSGAAAHGIYATVVNGAANITNTGTIHTNATTGGITNGIFAKASGSGDTSITNNANITLEYAGNALRTESTGTGNATSTHNGGDITLNGSIVSGAGAGAIFAMTSGTGAATVNMNGGTITSSQTGGNGIGFGLEAKATGSGDAIVNFNAGTITTYGGAITAWNGSTTATGQGNATVTTAAGTIINVLGAGGSTNSWGIYAGGGSSANNTKVTVDSRSDIQAYMYGIYANSTNGGDISIKQTGGSLSANVAGIRATTSGAIDITNSGTITTSPQSSSSGHGMWVVSNGVGKSVTINNSGDITVNTTAPSAQAPAIFAQSYGLLSVDNRGVLKTSGDSSHGIRAQGLSSANSANVSINNLGTVTTTGAGAYGLYASTAGTGDVMITGSGDVSTNDASTVPTYGVYANSVSGTAKIDYSGTVVTQSRGGTGLRAIPGAAGNASVIYRGPRVEVFGDGAAGLVAWSTNGAASVKAQGQIITHANGGAGSAAHGIQSSSSTGNVSAEFTGEKIDVDGTSSYAINAYSLTGSNTSTGTVTINNSGELITRGTSGSGILARTEKGDQSITNSGKITTYKNTAPAIDAQVAAGGKIDVSNSGALSTSGNAAYGISVSNTAAGINKVKNYGAISTIGQTTHAIYAVTAGQINIDNYAALTTSGNNSKGIAVNYSGASGGATVNHRNGASITTNGSGTSSSGYSLTNGAAGIYLMTGNSAAGDVTAIVDGDVTTNGTNRSGGVFVVNSGTGDAIIRAAGNILTSNTTGPYSYGLAASIGNAITSRGDASIYYTNTNGTVETRANESAAEYAYIDTNATGNVRIENAGTLKTSGDGQSYGVWARVLSGSGNATVVNHGAITTSGNLNGNGTPSGIRMDVLTGNADLTNSGAISTRALQADGIRVNASTSPSIKINNSGAVSTQGNQARGIYVDAGNAATTLSSRGNITTAGATQSGGIFVNAATAKISADISGNISTAGTYSPAVELISRRDSEGTGSNLLYFHDGAATVGAGSNAISLWTGSSTPSTGSGEVRIGVGALVDASHGLSGIHNLMPQDGIITIDTGARVIGGSDANNAGISGAMASGVELTSARGTLNNSGDISALSDRAIRNYNGSAQTTTLTNNGILTGYIALAGGSNSLNNTGQWNLRQFADTTGNSIRDTLSVAVSNFGPSGNNSITNSGVIALLGDNGQASTLNSSGAYSTGHAANTMAIGGAVQGQILSVKTFTNSGTIDMGPANAAVGDVLIISGGTTPGVSGGGTYIANGGRVILDTVLNEGDTNSASDMLVVDSTKLGSDADKITVINTGGAGALTVGNGIELVRVLDKANSAGGTFKLGSRVVAGVYEYDVYHGGVDADAGDGNWYLRSLELPEPPVPPVPPTPNPDPNPGPQPQPDTPVTPKRPEPGIYLRNMTAASGMFMHTLHDRLGEPQFTDKYQADTDGKVSSLWVRIVGNHSDGKAGNGAIEMKTDNSLVHMGGDLARWSSDGLDRWHIGLMGAYGRSDTDANMSDRRYTDSGLRQVASGNVDGYGAGAYLTWFGNQANKTGPYVDLWGMYGWYKNKVQGNTLAQEKYDSTNWTVSAETGYALVAHDGDKRQWLIEPQAQLAYNQYSEDDHREANGTWVTDGNSDGIVTRLGARVYSRSKLGDNGIQPFVEANWWHGTAQNTLRFNGALVDDGTPKDTYELKAGLQGEITKNWQLWGHVGGRWGSNSYSSYEGMVGVKYQF